MIIEWMPWKYCYSFTKYLTSSYAPWEKITDDLFLPLSLLAMFFSASQIRAMTWAYIWFCYIYIGLSNQMSILISVYLTKLLPWIQTENCYVMTYLGWGMSVPRFISFQKTTWVTVYFVKMAPAMCSLWNMLAFLLQDVRSTFPPLESEWACD